MTQKTGEFGIPEEAFERIRDPELLKRYMQGGKTFQQILGYTNLAMEGFYRAARRLFLQQRYEEAIEAFTFLTTLNPHVTTHWLGLGMSEQLIGLYEKALIAYGMAVATQPKNPIIHYHSASCYREMGDLPQAIAALEIALACAEEAEQAEFSEHCRGSIEALKKKK